MVSKFEKKIIYLIDNQGVKHDLIALKLHIDKEATDPLSLLV
jgi:hypothetical protein